MVKRSATGQFLPGNTGKNNPNPTGKGGPPPEEHKWKPGQSGNPGGKTSEQKRREMENAELATKARGRFLAALNKALGEFDHDQLDAKAAGKVLARMSPDVMRLLTDAENRGLGTPKQSVELGGIGGGPIRTINGDMTPQEAAEAYAATLHGDEE